MICKINSNNFIGSFFNCVDASGFSGFAPGGAFDYLDERGIRCMNEETEDEEAECVDPDGDGWCWDGVEPCLVPVQ